MPELPEVETVRLGLATAITGRRFLRVETRRPDLRFPFPPGFVRRLAGARILRLERRGKYILAALDTGEDLLLHLGMTGRFVVSPGAASGASEAERHAHVLFEMEDGTQVTFVDPRRFGFMDVVGKGERAVHPRLADLGPDPFDAGFDAPYLTARFRRSRQAVKPLLMDQTLVAGLGNIYVCEALHMAGIRPARRALSLTAAATGRIVAAIRSVLTEAIAAGGSTIRDYVAADGAPGYFQHRFKVYGRAGQACVRSNCRGAIRRSVQAGRATFACSACQR
jgi:formamidopyrimidine-DNA glycosylase